MNLWSTASCVRSFSHYDVSHIATCIPRHSSVMLSNIAITWHSWIYFNTILSCLVTFIRSVQCRDKTTCIISIFGDTQNVADLKAEGEECQRVQTHIDDAIIGFHETCCYIDLFHKWFMGSYFKSCLFDAALIVAVMIELCHGGPRVMIVMMSCNLRNNIRSVYRTQEQRGHTKRWQNGPRVQFVMPRNSWRVVKISGTPLNGTPTSI